MIFYFNSNGESLGFTSERVFQGSNLATRMYFVCPVTTTAVVSVAFTLPDGTTSGPHLMLSAEGEISGVLDSQGIDFNNWYFDIPESVTALSGNVGVQFAVTNGQSVITTSTCVFAVESGIYPQFSEQLMSYREIMAFLQRMSASGGNNSSEIEEDLSDLSDDITALQTRLTTAEGNITTMNTRLTTTMGNVSTLNGKITTAEGNITTLQGDISTINTALATKVTISDVNSAIASAIATAMSTPV